MKIHKRSKRTDRNVCQYRRHRERGRDCDRMRSQTPIQHNWISIPSGIDEIVFGKQTINTRNNR